MKQLGNLAVICAQRNDLCLTIYQGQATVHLGCGPERKSITVNWSDDEAINKLTYALNHGEYSLQGTDTVGETFPEVLVCYEENAPHLSVECGAVNEIKLLLSEESKVEWINERIESGIRDGFFVDEELNEEQLEAEKRKAFTGITMFRGHQENWNESFTITATKTRIMN